MVDSAEILCDRWGDNGWCVENARLSIAASDPGGWPVSTSGVAGGIPFLCGTNCLVDLAEGSGTATYTVTSASGRSTSGRLVFFYDPTPPTVGVWATGALGTNGWYVSAVQAGASGRDSTSGIAILEFSPDNGQTWFPSVTFDADGVYDLVLRAQDQAGNIEGLSTTLKVDVTPPTLDLVPAGIPGEAGWYRSEVTVSLQANDAQSGVVRVEYRVDQGPWLAGSDLVLGDGIQLVEGRATDLAGNQTTQSLTVSVDTLPPVLVLNPPPVDGSSDWYITQPALSASASDATSGMAGLEYRLDGSAWLPGSSVQVGEGSHAVEVRARDAAGNSATDSRRVQVDLTYPVLEIQLSGTGNASGWHRSDVMVSIQAADAVSGLDRTEYRLGDGAWVVGESLAISQQGVYTLQARATDRSGRVAITETTIKIDKTPPVSAFLSPGSKRTVVKDDLNISGRSRDGLSGLAKVEISLDEGKSWQPLEISTGSWGVVWDTRSLQNGDYPILVRARDLAGNLEKPIQARVMLANRPPRVVLQEHWMVWESGELRIRDAGIPLEGVRITIRDPQGRWPAVVFEYGPGNIPAAVSWGRRFGNGVLAPAGEYKVEARAWDIYGNEGRDTGKINIPFGSLPLPTWTPAGVPTPTASSHPTQRVQPTPQSTEWVMPTPVPVIDKGSSPETRTRKLALWPEVGLIGLFIALASSSLSDPRPAALVRMKETFDRIMKNQGE